MPAVSDLQAGKAAHGLQARLSDQLPITHEYYDSVTAIAQLDDIILLGPGSVELIRAIILGSTSMQAAFPPVTIEAAHKAKRYDEMFEEPRHQTGIPLTRQRPLESNDRPYAAQIPR